MSGFDEWYDNFFDENNCIPCASEAWNEQQKKIDAVLKLIDEYKDLSNNKPAYNYIPEIEEIIKCGKT